MMIAHHLDEATLVRYAAGDLDDAFLAIVAAHIAMCDTCRARSRVAETVGGALLETVPDAGMADGAFERLMRRIESDGNVDRIETAQPDTAGDVPLPLRPLIGNRLADISWRRVAPGIRKHSVRLSSPGRSSLFMLRIEEGMTIPEHGHGGDEVTLVLAGAYRDEFGRFGPGDVADLDEHVEHQPAVEAGGPCICIVAIEAPTRFRGLVSRLLQPLVGI